MTERGGIYNDGVIFSLNAITASINNLKTNQEAITIYPNPSNGKFNLVLSHAELVSASQTTIEIYNELGQIVFSKLSILNSPLSIDLSVRPNGIYLYRVISETGNLVGEGKLVIQR